MGYVLRLYCQRCNKAKEYRLGQGINDRKIENILEHFGLPERKRINDILKISDTETVWNYQKVLGICRKCGEVEDIPRLQILRENEKTVTIKPSCRCGGVYRETDGMEEVQVLCPRCHSVFTKEIKGIWD